MTRRRFTPVTARHLIGRLRPTAERMCELYLRLERHRPRRIVPEQPVDRAYFTLVSRLHDALGEIRAAGARVQDLRQGLLGFPARRAGREVLLSWKVGESSLGFWHDEDAGWAGRKPVDEDGPWEEAGAGQDAERDVS